MTDLYYQKQVLCCRRFGRVKWAVPEAEYALTLSIVSPTGFTVIERCFDSHRNLL